MKKMSLKSKNWLPVMKINFQALYPFNFINIFLLKHLQMAAFN